jgi:hypothetical protein
LVSNVLLPAQGIHAGDGLLEVSNVMGTALSLRREADSFDHPFRASMQGGAGIFFSRGLVFSSVTGIAREPMIGRLPMGGVVNGRRPALKIIGKPDKEGHSWVYVEVEPTEKGGLTEESRVRLVHSGKPNTFDPKIGRFAVAMILWGKASPVELHQIAHFHLPYSGVDPGSDMRPPSHLFI